MNSLKKRLRNREKTIGSWLAIPSEVTAEIMANAGFEWLVIDMEHAPIGVAEASRLIRIVDLAGLPALCRLPSNDPILAKNVLDAGSAGIIVPMIESKEDAVKSIEAVYYPPGGKRGVGLARAQAYGNGFENYKSIINDSLVVIAMIETIKGIKNVDSIAATPGIDGLLIGPYDISASLGVTGQLDHPEIKSASKKVIEATNKEKIGCGLHVVHPSLKAINNALNEGYTFLALGVDMIFLNQAAKEAFKVASKEDL